MWGNDNVIADLDFFFDFFAQNDKIWWEMKKKDKIEARKVIFAMFKVFSAYINTNLWKFIHEYMDMKYLKFKFLTLEHIDVFIFIKKMQNVIVLIKNCDELILIM